MKKYDVVAFGELLIDFTFNGYSAQQNELLEANPGGAPCNVLAMLAKLNKKAAFIGKVGDDHFGNLLKKTLEECNICTQGLLMDKTKNTTLAFVHTTADGDRDFSFYRRGCADTAFLETEIPEDLINYTKIFHFGTLSLTDEPSKTATQKAVGLAKQSGAIISFDPNLRPPLWGDLADAKTQIMWGLSQSDVVKISDNEIEFISSCADYDSAVAEIFEKYPDIKLLCLTKGKDGSTAYARNNIRADASAKSVKPVDTTGAGDTFCGCMLNYILENGLVLNENQMREMLVFANTAAAIVTTKKGAIKSMPTIEEILSLK